MFQKRKRHFFPTYICVTLTFSLFRHVKMKALVQAQRFIVYGIIDGLVARHRDGKHSLIAHDER